MSAWVRFLLVALILAACQPARPEILPTPSPSRALLTSPPSQTPLPLTSTARPTVTPTPTPSWNGFRLCSPLELHPLEELPQIVGDPYNPPPPGREERHHGVDFAYYHYQGRDSMQGEVIQAALAGRVAAVTRENYPYGNMVILETSYAQLPPDLVTEIGMQPEDGLFLLYAHMQNPTPLELGQAVQACEVLGEVGLSGNTDIPHLHLETRLGPAGHVFEAGMRFYDTRATIEEMDNYVYWRTSGVFRHFDPMRLLAVP